MSSREEPLVRPASRVIVISPWERVLLFRIDATDQETGKPFWFPPGGGLEDGESYEEAALRELHEETGLSAPLSPCLWHREHTWLFEGEGLWVRSIEQYFAARVASEELGEQRLTELERRYGMEPRWWSLGDMAASDHIFVPRRLGELLPPVLRGEWPAAPVWVE